MYRLASNRIHERDCSSRCLWLTGPHTSFWFMLIATLIPVADAVIVLHQGGSRTVAFGVHGGTAVAMLIISGLLLID